MYSICSLMKCIFSFNIMKHLTYANTITTGEAGYIVTDPAGNDVSDQFSVTPTNGSLEIAKRKVTLTSATDEKVYDGKALTNSTVTGADDFVDGEGVIVNVTGSQTLVGSSDNTFTYKAKEGTNLDNYTISKVEGTLTVTDGTNPDDPKPVDDDLVVSKTHETGTYGLGDQVEFTITATNIYDEARTITFSEIDGVKLAQSTFENVAAGATVETTATYTITDKRKELISFAGPYYVGHQGILVKSDNTDINDVADLAGKIVGVQEGSNGRAVLEEYAPDAGEVQELGTDEELRRALEQGRIDAYVVDATLHMGSIIENPGKYRLAAEFGPEDPLGIGLPLNSDGVAFVNNFLAEIESTGKWTELYNICLGTRIGVDQAPEPPAIA